MLVVSDTSPVSSLLQIGRVELLRDLFGNVCVPTAVRDELRRFHQTLPAFLEVRHVADQPRVQSLLTSLDVGEAEAIVLALESHADYLLVDERRGRAIAAQAGVPVIGLLGVLLLARKRNLIASVKNSIDELQATAGFYVADALVHKVLKAAGE
jgi:predicted nucleic acid-binding protein